LKHSEPVGHPAIVVVQNECADRPGISRSKTDLASSPIEQSLYWYSAMAPHCRRKNGSGISQPFVANRGSFPPSSHGNASRILGSLLRRSQSCRIVVAIISPRF
jgi:hypothetical protein